MRKHTHVRVLTDSVVHWLTVLVEVHGLLHVIGRLLLAVRASDRRGTLGWWRTQGRETNSYIRKSDKKLDMKMNTECTDKQAGRQAGRERSRISGLRRTDRTDRTNKTERTHRTGGTQDRGDIQDGRAISRPRTPMGPRY